MLGDVNNYMSPATNKLRRIVLALRCTVAHLRAIQPIPPNVARFLRVAEALLGEWEPLLPTE